MKQIILVPLFFLVAVMPLAAQFTRGTFMAGGALSYNHYKNNETVSGSTSEVSTESVIYVSPQVGYFLVNHLAVGFGFGYNRDYTKEKSFQGSIKEISKSIGPFARYYVHRFFVQAGYELGSGKITLVGFDGENSSFKEHSWRAGFGYAILLSANVAIEPLIGYTADYQTTDGSSTTDITKGLFLQAGIQVYLRKK
jgi:hypothetical protein